MKINIQFINILFLIVTLSFLVSCSHQKKYPEPTPGSVDVYNSWKDVCRKLNKSYKDTVVPPYHLFTDERAVRCSDPFKDFVWDADHRNTYILIMNIFYYSDITVRRRALEMLKKYDCTTDNYCSKFSNELKEHANTALSIQTDEWREEFLHEIYKLMDRAKGH